MAADREVIRYDILDKQHTGTNINIIKRNGVLMLEIETEWSPYETYYTPLWTWKDMDQIESDADSIASLRMDPQP